MSSHPEHPWISLSRNGELLLHLWIQPNAKSTAIGDIQDGYLRVKVAAPPVDDKANEALIAFLAKKLSISKSRIAIASGSTSRKKLLTASCDLTTVLRLTQQPQQKEEP